MRRLRVVALVIGIAATLVGVPASRLQACAPFVRQSVFWWQQLPEVDLAPYAHGNLGIVSPRYARSYLIVAYRVLSGGTISEEEAVSMQEDWAHHLNRVWGTSSSPERWQQARKRVRNVAAPLDISAYGSDGQFSYTRNVLDDAFETATETLRDRERRFGVRSPVFAAWVRAQDLVFAGAPARDVEALPMAAAAPALARADRAYQIASAAFYTGSYPDARARFLAIARDATSPWRRYGTYLAARSALREGDLAEARRLFDAVIADPTLATLHTSANGLLLRVRRLVERDDQFRRSVANAVVAPRPGPLFGDVVRHLALAIDRYASHDAATSAERPAAEPDLFPDEDPASALDDDFPVNPSWWFATTASLRAEHDLLDWIVTFQSTDAAAASHAANRWRQTRRPVWLVAAIAGLRSLKTAGAADIMAAAAALRPDSPAYATVTFHRARLLLNDGRPGEARPMLDRVLAGAPLPLSSTNRFRDLRLRTARSLDDLVTDLDVRAAGLRASGYPSYRFSADAEGCGDGDVMAGCDELRQVARAAQVLPRAAALIDGLPLDLEATLASDTRIAASVRRDITQAAWVRSFVLADDDRLRSLGIELSNQYAGVDDGLASALRRTAAAATAADRRFEAAWILVRHPVMTPFVRPGLRRLLSPSTIDDYGDNWWARPRLVERRQDDDEEGLLLKAAPFLDADSQRRATIEHRQLRAAGSAGALMARAVVDGARERLTDPRVPEALHRAVRATRLVGGGEWSRKAYALLHERFPNDAWTRRTRFWY